MGVGNYSEDDIKECARAFTGWTLGNTEYMVLRSMRDSDWPYGRIAWHFEYRPDDHDEGEKTFLGHTGNLNGEDIIEIICEQEATARFIARHMYHFFVADEPPVPSWPYTPPRDPEAIDILAQAYFDSDHDIKAMLTTLFNSDFFKSEDIRYEKVKGPAEFVTGVLRLTGEFDRPRREILDRYLQTNFMGQMLTNPPSVEGWHQGVEWIDTGTLIERINFASEQLGDETKPGVRAMVDSIMDADPDPEADDLVDMCLEHLGTVEISDENARSDSEARRNGRALAGQGSRTAQADRRDARLPEGLATIHQEDMPVVASAAQKVLEYSLTVGLSVMEGRGFYYPADTLPTSHGRLYVVNRSVDGVDRGVARDHVRHQQRVLRHFRSAAGDGDGQFVQACGIAEGQSGKGLYRGRVRQPRLGVRPRREFPDQLGHDRQCGGSARWAF